MTSAIPGFFQGTEMPNSGWWEALWPDPAAVLSATGIKPGMEVIDLCCGDGWFTLPIARIGQACRRHRHRCGSARRHPLAG